MGLISKIEDKLTGGNSSSSSNSNNNAASQVERKALEHEGRQGMQNVTGQQGHGSGSGGVSNLAQQGQHAAGGGSGLTGSGQQHQQQQQSGGAGGVVGKAENMLPGHHSGSGAQSSAPAQQSASAGGLSSAIPGQHSSTSGAHQSSIPGQHSSSAGGLSSAIPGQHSSTSGAHQSSMPGQFPGSSTSGAYDNLSSQSQSQGGTGSSLRHPIGNAGGSSGSAITGGTAVTGAGLAGAGLAGSQASHGAHGSSSYGREDPNVSSTSDRLQGTHLGNQGTSGTSTADYATPRQPMDPYSSKGQQAAANAADSRQGYGASQGRAEAGDYGSRSNVPASEVQRTSGGGISNGMSTGLHSGPHSHLENRDAIPTAGGEKLGSGAAGSSSAYDDERGLGHHGQTSQGQSGYASQGQGQGQSGHSGTGPASNTIGPHSSNIANIVDPRVQPDPSLQSSAAHQQQQQQHHTGRDAALAGGAGAAGAAAYGSHEKHAHERDGHHSGGHHHQHGTTSSQPQSAYAGSDATRGSYEQPATHHTGSHHHQYGTAGQSGLTGSDATRSSHDQPSSTSHQVTNTAPYGQNVSYLNRASADEPLSQDKSFIERHPGATAAGIGAGAGAVGAGAASHYESAGHHGTHSGVYDNDGRTSQHHTAGSSMPGQHQTSGTTSNIPGSQTSGLTGTSLPPQTTTTHDLSSQPRGSTGDNFSSQTSGSTLPSHQTSSTSDFTHPPTASGASVSKPAEGLSIAKRLGGAYEAGYRDALEHMRQEREGH